MVMAHSRLASTQLSGHTWTGRGILALAYKKKTFLQVSIFRVAKDNVLALSRHLAVRQEEGDESAKRATNQRRGRRISEEGDESKKRATNQQKVEASDILLEVREIRFEHQNLPKNMERGIAS
jgi:hypothetical protein